MSTTTILVAPRALLTDQITGWGDEELRQGFFELDPDSSDRPVYRLRWQSEDPLTAGEREHAEFIRYLIQVGRLTERVELDEN
jgi:hypothetical protein